MRSDAVHRVLEDELAAARRRRGGQPPQVLDIGGGSGVWAVPLAATGCVVTVIDPSPNALAMLQRRAEEAGVVEWVTPVQGDTDALSGLHPTGSADLVLAHGLLEYVEDVGASLRTMIAATAPGGALSVLAANRYAAVLGRALAGRLPEALSLYQAAEGRLADSADPVQRRFDADSLSAALNGAGVSVELVQGQGVLSDLVPGSAVETNPRALEAMLELERLSAAQPPMRDIASRLHAIARVAH